MKSGTKRNIRKGVQMVLVATQVKRRRGTTAENDAFTGAEGEIVVDTQKHTLRVHDGETQGGFEMATQADLDNKADTSYIDGLLATKADTDLGNIPTNYDYVVEKQDPTSANGYTWYRKYKSGWVEQGGIKLQNTDSKQALSLPIEMNGSTYSVLTSVMDDNLSNFVFCVKVTDKTTTGFKTTIWGSYQQGISTSGYNFVWQVSGMSAQ